MWKFLESLFKGRQTANLVPTVDTRPVFILDDLKHSLSSLDCLLSEELAAAANRADAERGYVKGTKDTHILDDCIGTEYMIAEKKISTYLVFKVSLSDKVSGLFSQLYIRGFEKLQEKHTEIVEDFVAELNRTLRTNIPSPEWPDNEKDYPFKFSERLSNLILSVEIKGGGRYCFEAIGPELGATVPEQGYTGMAIYGTNPQFRSVACELRTGPESIVPLLSRLPEKEPYSNITITNIQFH